VPINAGQFGLTMDCLLNVKTFLRLSSRNLISPQVMDSNCEPS